MMTVEDERVIKTLNDELDRKIGGFPSPSLNIVEGPNGSGKSTILQQIAWGALNRGLRVRYLTTENTVKSLLSQMESLSFMVTPFFTKGTFRIMELHTRGIVWDQNVAKYYLNVLLDFIKRDKWSQAFIIDSLSYILIKAKDDDVLDFFSTCRNLTDIVGKTFFIALHPYAVSQEMLIRIRSICDGHLMLSIREMRDRTFRILEVLKLRGANKATGIIVSFEVDPAFGIKVLPFSQAKA
ncbi:MAG: flagellar accessory protein FlaH [Thermoprotei archaeon]|nr:MAG: flagellar accessory protein FlaH [Thermoprotei archaeon]